MTSVTVTCRVGSSVGPARSVTARPTAAPAASPATPAPPAGGRALRESVWWKRCRGEGAVRPRNHAHRRRSGSTPVDHFACQQGVRGVTAVGRRTDRMTRHGLEILREPVQALMLGLVKIVKGEVPLRLRCRRPATHAPFATRPRWPPRSSATGVSSIRNRPLGTSTSSAEWQVVAAAATDRCLTRLADATIHPEPAACTQRQPVEIDAGDPVLSPCRRRLNSGRRGRGWQSLQETLQAGPYGPLLALTDQCDYRSHQLEPAVRL